MGLYDIQLYPASFGGASFYYTAGTNTAGRKTVIHEFPNKNFRFVEDLGKNLRTFTITGLVKGLLWLEDKSTLETALNTEGIQVLKHPFYGDINCVCTGYRVVDDDREIGVANFEMDFAEANENIFPAETIDNKSLVANLARGLYDKIGNFIRNDFLITWYRNISYMGDRLKLLVEELDALSDVSNTDSDAKAAFNISLDSFSEKAYLLPQNPGLLAKDLPELINSFDSLSNTLDDRDNINNKLFGFGEELTPLTLDSAEIVERDKNQKIINGSVNALALANLYENAILIEYQDDQELNAKIIELEDKYERLVFGANNSLDDDTLNDMQLLRDEWRKFYENLRLTINKIVAVKTKKMPLKTMVYQHYGNVDNFDVIMQLNNIRNPALIEGEFNILSQ
jgi:prophage DNA circulation protein